MWKYAPILLLLVLGLPSLQAKSDPGSPAHDEGMLRLLRIENDEAI